MTLHLFKPKAYGQIKPLFGSHGRPIRCTPVEPQYPENGHNWYYDLTDDHELSRDKESLLVWLCDECAEKLEDSIQLAGSDRLHDGPCWSCSR